MLTWTNSLSELYLKYQSMVCVLGWWSHPELESMLLSCEHRILCFFLWQSSFRYFPVLIVMLADACIFELTFDRVGRPRWWWLPGLVVFSAVFEAVFSALEVTQKLLYCLALLSAPVVEISGCKTLSFVLWIQLPVLHVLDLGLWMLPVTSFCMNWMLTWYLLLIPGKLRSLAVCPLWGPLLWVMVPFDVEALSLSIFCPVMLLLVWVPKLAG